MNEKIMRVRELRLQKMARIAIRKWDVNLNLMAGDKTAYISGKVIFINPEVSVKESENLILQKALVLHEAGHIKFTNSKLWRASGVTPSLSNTIEDGRVERAMSRVFPQGRDIFIYLNDKLQKPIPKNEMSFEGLIFPFILEVAKRHTSLNHLLSQMQTKHLKNIMKEDFDVIISLVKDATIAPDEEESIEITKKVEDIIEKYGCVGENIGPQGFPKDIDRVRGGVNKAPFNKDKEEQIDKKDEEDSFEKNSPGETLVRKVIEKVEKEGEEELANEVEECRNEEFGDYGKLGPEINKKNLEAISHVLAHRLKALAEVGLSWKTGQRSGQLDTKKLVSVMTSNNNKIFKKVRYEHECELSVSLLLDASGSMKYRNKSLSATQSCYILAKALELNKFKTEIVKFGNSKISCSKMFNQSLKTARFVPEGVGGTPMSMALDLCKEHLSKVAAKRKIIILISDGMPDNLDGTEIRINHFEGMGIPVFSIHIGFGAGTGSFGGLRFRKGRQRHVDEASELLIEMSKIVAIFVSEKRR